MAWSNDLRKSTADRAGVKANVTACECFAKSGTVAAKQLSVAKYALADILVGQQCDDLRGILEGRVPLMGQVYRVRSRPMKRQRIERRIMCHRAWQGNTVFRFLFSGAADAVLIGALLRVCNFPSDPPRTRKPPKWLLMNHLAWRGRGTRIRATFDGSVSR